MSGRPIVQHAGYLEHFEKRLNIGDRASRYKNPHVFRIGVSGPDRAGYWWSGIWECIYNRHPRTHEGASFVWYRYQGTPGQGERPWWNVESVAGRNNNMEMGGHTTSQTSPHTPEYWEYCTLSKHPRLSGSDLWFCKQSAESDLVALLMQSAPVRWYRAHNESIVQSCVALCISWSWPLYGGIELRAPHTLLLVLNAKLKPKDVSVCCSLLMVSPRNGQGSTRKWWEMGDNQAIPGPPVVKSDNQRHGIECLQNWNTVYM